MRFKFVQTYAILWLTLILLSACSTQKNTWMSRRFSELNTRYNIYFNGNEAYKAGVLQLETSFSEDFSKPLPLYEVSDQAKAKATASNMNRAIEKAQKGIKKYSIRVKPEKKPGNKAKPSAKAFYKQEEFNPFMDEVFMLMAKAQFTKTDFLSASATCSYILRHFSENKKACDEAGILQARALMELGWFYDAENKLNELNNDNLTPMLVPDISAAYADLYIRRKQYDDALPYLEIATQKVRKAREKQRWNFLLGQIYQLTDRKDKAYKVFSSIPSMNPPYEMELNARIRQSEVFPNSDTRKALKKLDGLRKSRKNTEYLDQIYYAISNLYLATKDTSKALENLELALKSSKKSGPQKRKTLLSLGQLYYSTEQLLKAAPCYSQVLPMMDKLDELYPLINKRAAILKLLAPHLKTIHDADSLLAIAKMPEAERNLLIADLIKKSELRIREEAKNKAVGEAAQANQTQTLNSTASPKENPPLNTNDKSWYFYNASTVESGIREFQRKWGTRPLIDDWRRLERAPIDLTMDTIKPNKMQSKMLDTTAIQPRDTSMRDLSVGADDPLNPNFYLKDLPFTEAQQKESDKKLAEALNQAGIICWEEMENEPLAIKFFNRLAEQFPQDANLEKAWYIMHLRYRFKNMENEAELTRKQLLNYFPNGLLSKRLLDKYYIENLQKMYLEQDSVFEEAYELFKNKKTDSLLLHVEFANENYPSSVLQPKYQYMAALEYARTGQADKFHEKLVLLNDSFPKSEVQPIVKQMLAYWDQGRRPIPTEGFTYQLSASDTLSKDSIQLADSLLKSFKLDLSEPHFIALVYDTATVKVNRLQFDVALYNFTNFLVRDYEMTIREIGKMNVLLVSGFENAEDAIRYQSFLQFQGLAPEKKYSGLKLLIVSESNLELLDNGASAETYEDFFRKNYTAIKPSY